MYATSHTPNKILQLIAFLNLLFALCLQGQLPITPLDEPADYADLDLQELMDIKIDSVYGASRFEQTLRQAPSSVTLLTSEEIEKFGYRSLEEALRGIRGIFITNDRNYSYIGVRGFNRPGDYNSRVLFLIDGHRINDNIYDSALLRHGAALDIDLVERIEVIRGPSSSVYGSNALLGVINIIPKTGADVDGFEVSARAGTYESYKTRLTYGKKISDDVHFLLSGSLYDSGGDQRWYDPHFDERISSSPYARNHGVARNWDGERAYHLYGNLKVHDFTLTAAYTNRSKEVPTASFDTLFNSREEETWDVRSYVDLTYNREFANDVSFMGKVAYDYYEYHGDYPYDDGEPTPSIILNKDESEGQWTTTEFQITKKVADRHTLVFGADYRMNFEQYQRNYDDNPRFEYFEADHTSHAAGVYSQFDLSLTNEISLNAGLRYDYYSNIGGELSPRLGIIYTPWEDSTFKLLYGQAFRAPNAYEQHYESADEFKPNSDLGPETIRTYEFVYEQALSDHLMFSAAAYHYEIDDLISQEIDPTDGFFVFENLDTASAQGLELELESRFDNGLIGRFSYALQRGIDERTDEELSNSPRHLAKLNLLVPLFGEKTFAGLELQYTGSSKTFSGRDNSGFFITNATLFSSQLAENLELSASVYNLFNEEYAYPASPSHSQESISQDGRTFGLKLTYRF